MPYLIDSDVLIDITLVTKPVATVSAVLTVGSSLGVSGMKEKPTSVPAHQFVIASPQPGA
jgi:hypothetical protein